MNLSKVVKNFTTHKEFLDQCKREADQKISYDEMIFLLRQGHYILPSEIGCIMSPSAAQCLQDYRNKNNLKYQL